MLSEGAKAPDFSLQGIDEHGEERTYRLRDLLKQGKPLILYVYPKDSTPGCTVEACDFRDNWNRLNSRAIVVGVSKDSIKSHRGFQKKNSLNFILLSDPECRLLKAYGAWGEKTMYGRKTEGTVRSTFLIGPDGRLRRIWSAVKVKGHVDEVVAALEAE